MAAAVPPMKVNILIPMAGRGSRFADQEFVQPKPLIDVGGKTMIERVLDNVDSELVDATFVLLVPKEQRDADDLIARLRPLKAKMEFAIVDRVAEGAARTALLAKEFVNDDDVPLFIADSDQFVQWDVDAFWKDRRRANEEGVDGDVLCFRVPTENNDTKWSYYAQVGEDGYITDLKEKVVMSENATVGMYYWARGSDFVESAEAMIAADDRVKGEFDVALAYIHGIKDHGRKYTVSFCEAMYGLGAPHDVTRFLSDYARPKLMGGSKEDPEGRKFLGRTSGPMVFIAHRGNIDGPNPAEENKPEYLAKALSQGFDVEVDAWLDPATGQWALGHDGPAYPVNYDFLLTPGFWIHAKNGAALRAMVRDPRIHCFSHDKDDYTLTSRGYIWAYPDVDLAGTDCIAVMYSRPEQLLDQGIGGLCHDVVGPLRDRYLALRKPDASVCSRHRTVRLVVFDLDGVLVESRDLHYEALNRALEEEAGAQYVISRDEHERVYEGLSTDQKLKMLEVAKGLPRDLHRNVCEKNQEYTDTLVKEVLSETAHILKAVKSLKQMCLPVCVASNCIKSSVKTILTRVGLMPHIDVLLSNESVDNPKPAPDMYQKACAIFGVDPSSTLVVEDTSEGFEAASRAGCHLLRVSNTEEVTEASVKSRIQELESLTEDVTVVVPLAGPYPEIWQARETPEMPLYLADVAGVSVLELIGESLRSRRYVANYIFVVKESVAKAFDIDALCAKAVNYAPLKIVKVKVDSLSSIHTMLHIPNEYIPDNAPLLVADGHHIPVWKDGESLDDLLGSHADAAMTVIQRIDPRFSYVRLNMNLKSNMDPMSKQGPNSIVEVTMESRPSSNLAASGLYYFKQASYLFKAAKAVIAANERWLGRFHTAQTFNEMVKDGLVTEALHLKNSWSLRTVSEVQSYERFALPAIALGKLGRTYDEMVERHSRNVAEKGLLHDKQLLESEIEPTPGRRCLAVYCLCDDANWKPTVALPSFVDAVRDIIGENHCYYAPLKRSGGRTTCTGVPSGVLHWTYCQLIGFEHFDEAEVPEGYGDVVEGTLLRHLPRVRINFARLVMTPANILLLGFPTADVNGSRFRMRRSLDRCGLPLFEPYLNDIVHMTLVRFASPIGDSEVAALKKTVLDFDKSLSFGSLAVDELKLSPATWKMQAQELSQYQARTMKLL